MPRLLPTALLTSLVAIGTATSACGARTVDPNDAATKISAKIAEQQPTLGPVTVSCPSDVRAEKGTSFQCAIAGPDVLTGSVEVTETDDAGTITIRYPAPPGTGVPIPPSTALPDPDATAPSDGRLGVIGPAFFRQWWVSVTHHRRQIAE
jgi:hypothetical protein